MGSVNRKNIFITGAAGFIGFHLASRLQAIGHHVIGYDNFNAYYNPALKRRRALMLEAEGIKIVEGDICDMPLLQQCIEKHQTTHLIHLAAQAGVRYSIDNPQAYVKANLEGFVNILESCRRNVDMKLIYASSSSVYGLNEKVPFAESDRTDHQASLYGATKKTNELLAGVYHHLYGIPVTGLRFFTVYGPWGRPDMAYFSFTQAILAGKPIDVFNEGELLRDFTYIDDIIDGTAAAIELGAKCEIFNLGHHQPVKLLDFIATLEETLGRKAIMRYRPMQAGDVIKTYAEITHSAEKLQFAPKISLKEGLARFVAWRQQCNNDEIF